MNKHIELVKKWLKDKDAVSLEELQANKKAATAYDAAYAEAAEAADVAGAAYYAADAAADAAKAAYWVKRYEGLTK